MNGKKDKTTLQMRHDASYCINTLQMVILMGFDFSSDDVLLDINEVCKKLSISRSTLERLRRPPTGIDSFRNQAFRFDDEFAGLPPFPEPTIVLGRSPRWSASDLNAWITRLPKR